MNNNSNRRFNPHYRSTVYKQNNRQSYGKRENAAKRNNTPVRESKKSGGARFIAAILIFGLFLSIAGTNIVSIADLLNVRAAQPAVIDGYEYYDADLTLYDYYDDACLDSSNYSTKNSANQRFGYFNNALIADDYVSGATSDTNETYEDLNNLYPTPDHPYTYYPLYLGLQHQSKQPDIFKSGTKNYFGSWNDVVLNDYNYSLSANAQAKDNDATTTPNLVNDTFTSTVTQENGVELPYFSSTFLEKNFTYTWNSGNSTKTYHPGEVQAKRTFRFRRHSADVGDSDSDNYGYYVFDSRYDGYIVSSDGKTFTTATLGTTVANSNTVSGHYNDETGSAGFFPLGQDNYGFGAKFDINFTMTDDGYSPVLVNGNRVPMKFTFSGDDDVRVFIDGELALDVGGAHGRVEASIDFSTKRTSVTKAKKPSALDYSKAKGNIGDSDLISTTTLYDGTTVSGVQESIEGLLSRHNVYGDPTKSHKLTVFYMERGRLNSNCMITFNFDLADTIAVNNNIDASNVNPVLRNAAVDTAKHEGIEYILVNKGASTTTPSPDDGKTGEALTAELPSENTDPETNAVYVKYYDGSTELIRYRTVARSGDTVELVSSPPGRSGYRFTGWATSSGGAVVYSPRLGNTVTLTSDLSLYAVWEEAPVVVNLNTPYVPTVIVFVNKDANMVSGNMEPLYFGTAPTFETVTVDSRQFVFSNYTSALAKTRDESYNVAFRYKWGTNDSCMGRRQGGLLRIRNQS